MKIILLGAYLILSVSGLLLMKLGGNTGSFTFQNRDIMFNINYISAIGFICYILSFILFTKIVIMFELSYIFPILTGIIQVATLISSKILLKESTTLPSIIGACVIILGIIIMNIPKAISN